MSVPIGAAVHIQRATERHRERSPGAQPATDPTSAPPPQSPPAASTSDPRRETIFASLPFFAVASVPPRSESSPNRPRLDRERRKSAKGRGIELQASPGFEVSRLFRLRGGIGTAEMESRPRLDREARESKGKRDWIAGSAWLGIFASLPFFAVESRAWEHIHR